jgi:predicted nucleic acid-binding protein
MIALCGRADLVRERMTVGEWALCTHVRRIRSPISPKDGHVAAQAHRAATRLVMAEKWVFERLPGLSIQDWIAER